MLDKVTRIYSWFTGIALVLAVAALGWYYFTFDARNIEAVSRVQESFYENLEASWFSPKLDEMVVQALSSDTDQLELMVLRTAMGRWRLQSKAPTAYNRLVSQFGDGLWNDGFLDGLSAALANIDLQWKAARKKVIARGGRVRIDVIPVEKLGFKLIFPAGVSTADIGSLLEVSFTVDNDSPPPAELLAIWLTVLDNNPRPYRQRHCVVEETGRRHNGQKVYRVTMDMSDSPEWLNPVVQITSIHFNPQVELGLTALEYKVGDSKLLPVQ